MKFWFHYNKPMSRQRGCNMLTLHYKGACHFVKHIELDCVSLRTKTRTRQPRCILSGDAARITIEDEVAYII